MSDADVVVIGGGIAGLVGAGLLARAGYRVVLLEKHERLGGCLGSFETEGYSFGVGPQSFGSGGVVIPILDDLGCRGEGGLAPSDWRIVTPRVDCRIRTYEGVLGTFADAHPGALPGLRRYFNDVFATSRDLEKLVGGGSRAPYLLDGAERVGAVAGLVVGAAGAIARLAAAHHRPAAQVAQRYLRDPELVSFFSQIGYRRWSLFAAAAAWYSWTSDSWHPTNGFGGLVEAVALRAREAGAVVRTGVGARRIELSNGRATAVEDDEGTLITARAVLAACDPQRLELELLGREEQKTSVDAVSDAYVTLFLGVDLPEEELASLLPTRHTFFYPSYDRIEFPQGREDAHLGRWVQVVAPSRGCHGLAPEGCSTLVVQTSSRADWADSWGCGGDKERTPRYEELKARVSEELLETVVASVPGLAGHLRLLGTATPLTYERYTRNAHGASAGWTWERSRSPVPERVAETFGALARVKTRIPGLYRCGHWTLSPGAVTGACLSAWEAVMLMARESLP